MYFATCLASSVFPVLCADDVLCNKYNIIDRPIPEEPRNRKTSGCSLSPQPISRRRIAVREKCEQYVTTIATQQHTSCHCCDGSFLAHNMLSQSVFQWVLSPFLKLLYQFLLLGLTNNVLLNSYPFTHVTYLDCIFCKKIFDNLVSAIVFRKIASIIFNRRICT